ncbi:MAG: hypothetical protein MnENMB40S_29010 [Rhizobiaceae bacterium MnEN-MB40S]|nr:MAG: hypothetical protein MnENMB40S_29010 [Rhizobiaceae bacterium MnEN-MB40S]
MARDDENPDSHLTVVSENSAQAINKERAQHKLDRPLRNLAANIMRVSRGAGEPYEIVHQCVDFLQKVQEYQDKIGRLPDPEFLSSTLSCDSGDKYDWNDPYSLKAEGLEIAICGALRVTAARLLRQKLQESHGDKELMQGINQVLEYREKVRAEREEQLKAERRAARAISKGKTKQKAPRKRR